MFYFTPKRWDEQDESLLDFFRNLLWGMWVNNEYTSVMMTCGNCGLKSLVKSRSRNPQAQCPICLKFNKVKAI
jgi:DNA-directed RNA polymerase subunit RPC12/RpoP